MPITITPKTVLDNIGRAIDRFACAVSPEWGYRRLGWRSEISSYDSGKIDHDGWVALNAHGSVQDRSARDKVRAQARDLERNSDFIEAIELAKVRNVVGQGFRLQARVTDKNGEIDEPTNRIIERLWEDHCRFRNFDVAGRQSCTEMLRLAQRRKDIDGGIFFVKCYTSGGTVPLCWQMREVDELDLTLANSGYPQANGNYIVDGIEVDKFGKRVAYWFRSFSPDGFQQLLPERVDADRVIFLENFKRPTQPREMSPYSTSIQRLRQADGYLGDVTKQARVSSRFAAFIKRVAGGGMIGRSGNVAKTDPATDLNRAEIPSGLIMTGQPGDEIQIINPPQIGTSPRDLTGVNQRLTSAAQGLSYEAGSRDCSQVNFASGRLNRDGDIDTYRMDQQHLIDHALYEMYTEFLISAAISGQLPFTIGELLNDKQRYMTHEFVGRGWPWNQPLQEANANKIALDTGQTTLHEIAAEQGKDWRDQIDQRIRELKYEQDQAKAAGITLPTPQLTNGGAENAATTEK